MRDGDQWGAGVGRATVDHGHHQGEMIKVKSSWEAKLAGPGEEGSLFNQLLVRAAGRRWFRPPRRTGCKGSNGWSFCSVPEERGRRLGPVLSVEMERNHCCWDV